jgi:hypothetical protein
VGVGIASNDYIRYLVSGDGGISDCVTTLEVTNMIIRCGAGDSSTTIRICTWITGTNGITIKANVPNRTIVSTTCLIRFAAYICISGIIARNLCTGDKLGVIFKVTTYFTRQVS